MGAVLASRGPPVGWLLLAQTLLVASGEREHLSGSRGLLTREGAGGSTPPAPITPVLSRALADRVVP